MERVVQVRVLSRVFWTRVAQLVERLRTLLDFSSVFNFVDAVD